MYIKKQIREDAKLLNDYLLNVGYPKGFENWLNDKKVYLGFKNKNSCNCSYCNKTFKTLNKINEYVICPKCKKRLLLKKYNIKHFDQKDYYSLMQPYKKNNKRYYVIRLFEVMSRQLYYCPNKMDHTITEYGRLVVKLDGRSEAGYIINTMKKNISGYYYIEYWNKVEYWKPYDYLGCYGLYYPKNIDKILKPKYFSLEQFFNNTETNMCDILRALKSKNYVFEILIKSKLYNLASDYYYFKKGKFEKTFGIDKSYLPFMQENNITYEELEILRVLKIKDINVIRHFCKFGRQDTKRILKYCKVNDIYHYKLKPGEVDLYLDYLNFAEELGYSLKDKVILYPKNLKEKHDEFLEQIDIKKNKPLDKKLYGVYKKNLKNEYHNKKYIIIPARSYESLLDESKQQNNCVRTYANRIAKRECDIYFMRLVSQPDKSLVTVEVRNNKVVQQRTKNNYDTTINQKQFLKKWEKEILNKCKE